MQTPTRSVLTATLALAVFLPVPAHAQFGGLVNKAKEKMAQQVAPVVPGEQLTDDLLSHVITGASAADRVLADRDRITAARDAKNKELSALYDRNQQTRAGYNQASQAISQCRSGSFNVRENERKDKMEARAKELQQDPAFLGKMQLLQQKYMKQIMEAQQKNDPVALQKAQMGLMQEVTGMDVFAEAKKDTAAVDSKCGKMPALPAALAEEERIKKTVAAQDDSLRTLEASAVNAGAAASGLEQIRYLALKERTLGMLNKLAGNGTAKFGDEEMAAIRKRQPELEKLRRAL